MAQHGGAADSYYNAGGAMPMQYQQPQPQYPPPKGAAYQQPPPTYGPDYHNGAPSVGGDGKQTFEQAFKIDRPKYNDLWAGILVR